MVTQNGNTPNLAVLLIGLAGIFSLLSAGNSDVGRLIVGIVLILLLRGYRGNICEAKQGRLIYSAIWALNFLIAINFLLSELLLRLPESLFQWRSALLGRSSLLSPEFLVIFIIWLVTLLICKAYYDRKAASSLAQNATIPSPTTHP